MEQKIFCNESFSNKQTIVTVANNLNLRHPSNMLTFMFLLHKDITAFQFQMHIKVVYVYISGYAVSIAALLVSLAIFFYFR